MKAKQVPKDTANIQSIFLTMIATRSLRIVSSLSIHFVQIHGVVVIQPVSTETIVNHSDSAYDLDHLSMRRLAETYDATTASIYAHVNNGSMACTVNNEKLLFAYRPLTNSSVCLFDAGNHVHCPLGVGFLCVPTDNREIGGAS